MSKDLSKELEFASNLLMNTTFEVVRGEAESGSPSRCGCGVELNDLKVSYLSLSGSIRRRYPFMGPPAIFLLYSKLLLIKPLAFLSSSSVNCARLIYLCGVLLAIFGDLPKSTTLGDFTSIGFLSRDDSSRREDLR